MSEQSPDTTQDVEDLDVTRYKTKELTQRFQQLFGVVHLLPWAGAGLGGCMVTTLVLWALFFLPQASTNVAVLTFVYMGLQGLFLGLLAAALLIIARLLQQLAAILDITLQTLRQAFADFQNIGDPEVRAELTAGLVHGAIMPAVKSAITIKMGLLRAPIGFVINKLLDRSAKKMTKDLKDKTRAAGELPEHQHQSPPSFDVVDATPALSSETDSHLDLMRERVDVIARRTRYATLIPALLFFVTVAAVSSIPWVVALSLIFI